MCHWLELLPAISESLPAASTMRARALVITPDQPARGPFPGSPSHAATANEREAKRAVGRRAGWPLRTLTVPGGSPGAVLLRRKYAIMRDAARAGRRRIGDARCLPSTFSDHSLVLISGVPRGMMIHHRRIFAGATGSESARPGAAQAARAPAATSTTRATAETGAQK